MLVGVGVCEIPVLGVLLGVGVFVAVGVDEIPKLGVFVGV